MKQRPLFDDDDLDATRITEAAEFRVRVARAPRERASVYHSPRAERVARAHLDALHALLGEAPAARGSHR